MTTDPTTPAPDGAARHTDPLAVEYVLEKKRLRRSRFWWRLTAIFLIVATVISALAVGGGDGPGRDHIARFTVEGVIRDDPRRDALLKKLAEDDRVKAVIVRINSPGGSTVGGEALYESLRAIGEKKPVIAVMSEVAASAGYITALATDRIVARGNTITASVGVIFSSPNVAEALEKLGVRMIELRSGERKARPSPFQDVDVADLDVERALIADSFDWFIGLVADRRTLSAETRALIRDGRILSGRQALKAGLVDEIGGETEAVAWLAAEKGVDRALPVLERKVPPEPKGLFGRVVDSAVAQLGFDPRWAETALAPRLMSILPSAAAR